MIFDNKQNKKMALEHKDYIKYLEILIEKKICLGNTTLTMHTSNIICVILQKNKAKRWRDSSRAKPA